MSTGKAITARLDARVREALRLRGPLWRIARPERMGESNPDALLSTFDAAIFQDDGKSMPIAPALSEYVPKAVRWLWPGRLPLAMFCLLTGQEGSGKTFMAVDWAARVTRGLDWPDGASGVEPSEVVFMSAEDHPSYTLHPRALAAGADVSRIRFFTGVQNSHGKIEPFDPQTNILGLDLILAAYPKCKLVVIDPITSFLGEVDQNNNAEVRGALNPLGMLAARRDVCILGLTHQNKAKDQDPRRRTLGSTAFAALARSVLRAEPVHYGACEGKLHHDKCNVAILAEPLQYQIRTSDVVIPNVDTKIGYATYPEQLAVATPNWAMVNDWVRTQLADGPLLKKVLEKRGLLMNPVVTVKQLNVAKYRMGLVTEFGAQGPKGGATWRLPTAEEAVKQGVKDL
jgi:hypothetical protein